MNIKEITDEYRGKIKLFFIEQWGSSEMVISSGIYECDTLNGFFLEEYGQIIGLITYWVRANEVEIISLDSRKEGKGIGSKLLEKVEDFAKQSNFKVVSLLTTNDNLNALKFYQKRGYRITEVIPNAVNEARNLKPSIPLMGSEGIPLHDELKLTKIIYE